MAAIPEIVGVSALRLRQNEILGKLSETPVILTQHGKPVAVLVSPEHWNRLIEELEDLRDALDVLEDRLNAEPTIDFDEYLARRGERVPTTTE